MAAKVFLALCLCVVAANATQWTNLKVHFDVNLFSKYYYQSMPRQTSEMKANSWVSLSGSDCTNNGKYNGFRFMDAGEQGMALLYDTQGTIAGIQQILNKAEIETNSRFNYSGVPQYNPDTLNGVAVYVITAYFVDPDTICNGGRPSSDLTTTGTGTGIQIQSGPTPATLLEMPRNRADAISQGWTKNKCFVGMGNHNFYKVEDMAATNCLNIVPFFGLYDENDDQLGFGFAAYGTSTSNHFEHPPAAAVKLIVGSSQVPQCLLDAASNPGLSTMHVFFNNRPNLYTCL